MKAYKLFSFTVILFLSGILFFSLDSAVIPSDYVQWVINPENDLRKIKKVADIKIDVQYKPIPFIITNELRTNTINKKVYKKRVEELEGAQYFTIKVSVDPEVATDITQYKVSNVEEHQNRLYYLSYQLQNDIKLIEGKDTLAPQLFHFERAYDLAPHRTFVMAFETKKKNVNQDKVFLIDSPALETGPIKIKFKAEDLNNLPTLKLQ